MCVYVCVLWREEGRDFGHVVDYVHMCGQCEVELCMLALFSSPEARRPFVCVEFSSIRLGLVLETPVERVATHFIYAS